MEIRRFKQDDIDAVMGIWLASNSDSHSFVPVSYWRDNYDAVKSLLPEAEVFLCEVRGIIEGFVGITSGGYVAGLFVAAGCRGRGIGSALLEYVKAEAKELYLDVFVKNEKAVAFYQQHGFIITQKKLNEATGEHEYSMVWKPSE